jgi:hypothetical protein
LGGHSPGTQTVGVFLFGLVNERIGDLHSLRIGKGSIGRNHVSEMPVFRPLGEDIDPSGWLDERIGLYASVEVSVAELYVWHRVLEW